MTPQEFIAKARAALADRQSAITAESAQLDELELAIVEFGNERFQAGKDAMETPDATDPKAQYTQEQLEGAVSTGMQQVRDELQPQVDALTSQNNNLVTEKDLAVAAKDSAISAMDEYAAKVTAAIEAEEADSAADIARLKAAVAKPVVEAPVPAPVEEPAEPVFTPAQ